MPQAIGLSLNLTDTLEKAARMDRYLDNWVSKSEQISQNLRAAFSGANIGDTSALTAMLTKTSDALNAFKNMNFTPNMDMGEVQKFADVVSQIIKDTTNLSQSGGVMMFDNKNLYTTEERLSKIKYELDNITKALDDRLKASKKFETISANISSVDETALLTELGISNTNGVPLEKVINRILEQNNQEIKILQEKKAIYQEYYNWLNQTESERYDKAQKYIKGLLSEEQKEINSVRREYKNLLNELATVEARKTNYASAILGAKSAGAAVSPDLQRQYNLSIQSEQEMLAHKKELETQYWEDVKDIAQKFIGQQADIQIKEQERVNKEKQKQNEAEWNAYLRSPQGAIQLSNDAKSINEEKEAIQFLIAARDNLSKSTQDYDKIIKELNDRIQKHRISVEELTTAEKNENSLQPKVRNEYARLLKELDNIDAAKKRLAETEKYKSGDAQAIADMQALEARYNDVANKKIEIEQNAQGKLDEVVRQHEANRAQERLAQTEKTEAEIAKKKEEYAKKYGTISSSQAIDTISDSFSAKNIAEMEKYISKLREAKQKLNRTDADYEETVAKLTSRISKLEEGILRLTDATEYQMQQERKKAQQDPIGYAKSAKSVEQYRIAIDALKKEQEKLDVSTSQGKKKYREIDDTITRLNKNMAILSGNTNKLNGALNSTSVSAGKLGTLLASVFSIRQITGYVNKVIQVRGEFELQHRSLQVLIQDVDKANELWDKTVALAVKSPFRVKELVTYTKQLAAYRVEADKLYETNKMLADVSAGLGVDMNRLILAFGQVKAANYLRGTELRQFSEAGVNILDELAQKFSEVEGRVVSVGDVFERVSKRMVSFKDVEEVFQKITSEGGMFYQMQEKQAETLKGMMMNLRDSIDIMLNDIGISNESFIKNSVMLVKNIVDEWRKFIPLIKAAGVTFMSYFGTQVLLKIVKAFQMLVIQVKSLFVSFNAIKALSVGGAVVTVLLTIITYIKALRNNVDEITAKLTEVENNIRKQLTESIQLYKKYADTIRDVTKTNEEREKAEKKIQDRFKDILPDTMLEAEYIKQMGDNYDDAYNAMMNYYNAKAAEQKKDRINQMYEERIYGDDYAKIVGHYKDRISGLSYIDDRTKEILKANISGLFNEAIEAFKKGETNSIQTYFRQLVEEFSGYQIPFESGIEFTRQIGRIGKAILDQKQALEGLNGLPFRTLEEALAAKNVNPIKENVSTIEEVFKRLLNMYKDFSKQTEEQKVTINKDAETIISQLPDELKQYEPIIRESLDNIKANAEQGTFEFNSSLEKMQQDFLNNIITTLKEMSNGDIDEATKQLLDNYIKSLEDRAKGLDYTGFQNAITQAIQMVSKESGIEIDKFTKYIADKSSNRSSIAKSVEADIKQYQEEVTNLQNSINAVGEGNQQVSEDIMDTDKQRVDFLEQKMIPALQHLYRILGGNGDNDSNKKLDQQLKVIDDMNKKYRELRKTFGENTSVLEAFNAYKDAFADAVEDSSIKNMDYKEFQKKFFSIPNENSIIKYLDTLVKKAKTTSEKIKIQLKQGDYTYDVKVRLKEKSDKDLNESIKKLFDNYDLTKELKNLGLNQDLAKALFNFDYIDLDEIRNQLTQMKNLFIGTEQEEKYKQYLQDIDEMEKKDIEERMKTYTKYLLTAQSERVKLKLEELKKLREVDNLEIEDTVLKERMKANIQKEYEQNMLKQQWEDFKGSDIYGLLFEDLNNMSSKTLTALNDELSKIKKSLTGLPVNEYKEMIKQIQQIEDVLIKKDPFGQLKKAYKELQEYIKRGNYKTREEAEIELINVEAEMKKAQDILDVIDLAKAISKQKKTDDLGVVTESLSDEQLAVWDNLWEIIRTSDKSIDSIISDSEFIIKNSEIQIKLLLETIKLWDGYDKSIQGSIKSFSELLDKTNSISDSVKTFIDVTSGGMDEVTNSIFESIDGFTSLIQSALSFAAQMKTIGYATNMALGVIGWIAIGLQAIVSIVKAIYDYNDAKAEKKINDYKQKIENLTNSLEKLDKAFEEAFSIDSIKEYDRQMQEINAKMIEYQKGVVAVAKERAFKYNFNEKYYQAYLDEFKKLEDMQEKEADRVANTFSTLTDGILDNILDASQGFVDAWFDAFEETGDGLSGLEEEFNDTLVSMMKRQAALQIAGAFAERWKQELKKYIDPEKNDYEITKEEAMKFAEEVKKTLPELSDALEAFLGSFANLTNQESGLSGLEKGIQGITEQQAEVLAAYWNASRQSLANIDDKVGAILSKLTIFAEDNPIISQLKIIAKNTGNLYMLIDGMTTSFHGGGRALKVAL